MTYLFIRDTVARYNNFEISKKNCFAFFSSFSSFFLVVDFSNFVFYDLFLVASFVFTFVFTFHLFFLKLKKDTVFVQLKIS